MLRLKLPGRRLFLQKTWLQLNCVCVLSNIFTAGMGRGGVIYLFILQISALSLNRGSLLLIFLAVLKMFGSIDKNAFKDFLLLEDVTSCHPHLIICADHLRRAFIA